MGRLFKILAGITVDTARTNPFFSGYRPGFLFDRMQTSGQIIILDREFIMPGENAVVEVWFFSDRLLGDIKPGSTFEFYEGPLKIGSGTVKEVIGWIEHKL